MAVKVNCIWALSNLAGSSIGLKESILSEDVIIFARIKRSIDSCTRTNQRLIGEAVTFTKIMVGNHICLPESYLATIPLLADALDGFEFKGEVLQNDESQFLKDIMVTMCNLNEANVDFKSLNMSIDEVFR